MKVKTAHKAMSVLYAFAFICLLMTVNANGAKAQTITPVQKSSDAGNPQNQSAVVVPSVQAAQLKTADDASLLAKPLDVTKTQDNQVVQPAGVLEPADPSVKKQEDSNKPKN